MTALITFKIILIIILVNLAGGAVEHTDCISAEG